MAVAFRTTVEPTGKTATFLRVPADVVAALGTRKRPAVRVTVGDHTFRSTIAVYGDEFLLPLNAANRAAAGVTAGDDVDVVLELDTAVRIVDVPDDLRTALEADRDAAAAFDALSYSHRREYVDWITEAKRPATRQRRVAGTIERVLAGKTQR